MQKITPFLWFNTEAEEAAKFYTSIFKKSKIGKATRYDKDSDNPSGLPRGSVMTVPFKIAGQEFTAINGGPIFKFTEAISFVIKCKDQKEVDYYWEKLTSGGQEVQCGWLKDKYGLSWQIVPEMLTKMIGDKNPQRAARIFQAMLSMKKIEIQPLKDAYAGR